MLKKILEDPLFGKSFIASVYFWAKQKSKKYVFLIGSRRMFFTYFSNDSNPLLRASEVRKVFSKCINGSNFRKFRPGLAWLSGFWKPQISSGITVSISKQKPTDSHYYKLKLIKFWQQSIELNRHEVYPNSENFQQFLNKLTFVTVISPKLSEVKMWNKIRSTRKFNI